MIGGHGWVKERLDGAHARCGGPGICGECFRELVNEYPTTAAQVVLVRAESLARRFHETYERLAPDFGYETREASAKPWDQVPVENRRLMVAVCAELLKEGLR